LLKMYSIQTGGFRGREGSLRPFAAAGMDSINCYKIKNIK
jgi:hypothetical protein